MKKAYDDKDFFTSPEGDDIFEFKSSEKIRHRCITDDADTQIINEKRSNSDIESVTEIVVGIGNEIPLWKKNITLKWMFNPIFETYNNSSQVKNYIRNLFTTAISMWGDSSPINFIESSEQSDFDITMRPDNCNANGCTLASAFFPNDLNKTLSLYPKMFQQSREEQVETMVHEIGHIFGLRHFFAKELESRWRSEIFGDHVPLTIMNYGIQSTLTEQDKSDLKTLYRVVWANDLTRINGLPIKLYSSNLIS